MTTSKYVLDGVEFEQQELSTPYKYKSITDYYTKSKFLLLPKTINGHTRWFEFVCWEGIRRETPNAFDFDTDMDSSWVYDVRFSLRDKVVLLSITCVKVLLVASIPGTILWSLLSYTMMFIST